jgi:hypothetical protein
VHWSNGVLFSGGTAVLASTILVRRRQHTKVIFSFVFLREHGAAALGVVVYWLVVQKF